MGKSDKFVAIAILSPKYTGNMSLMHWLKTQKTCPNM